ncbi:MAG: isoleucine--tRNA ligase [Pelagimonas sp.]|jgi:isoleucyl-tRNA synthetase|nr:isoleucine--tRNA ligase [Pelagimonas sp.]
MTRDYKDTIFKLNSAMPQRGNLPKREPEMIERWAKMDMFKRIRESGEGRPLYLLHDGPPYANGNIHIGHAMNKVLKDVINRSRQMTGYQTNYVPGWDCHGLPIEWQIEKQYREAGKNKDDVPVMDFRDECAAFADHWIGVQREEFKRLGINGDWENPYLTVKPDSEAYIVEQLGKFLMDGSLYRGAKPVMWSVVEKTALAEAEIEYHDHTSPTIYVRFPVVEAKNEALIGAGAVIWTTTPWTIPANKALAYGPDIEYVMVEVTALQEFAKVREGDRLIVARALLDDIAEALRFTPKMTGVEGLGKDLLAGMVCEHPLAAKGFDGPRPLLEGDFVEADAGTGLVHMAPDHGIDDAELCARHDIQMIGSLHDDGTYTDKIPEFAGVHVFKATDPVCDALKDAGALLRRGKLVHSYPHSWRSKAPVIYRATPQWFISMEKTGIREAALKAVDDTAFYPDMGRNRIRAMVEGRPDWCISRQRSWGIPIAVFVEKETGEPLRDEAVMARVVEAFRAEGAGTWFTSPASRFLGEDRNPEDYEQIFDILDVWFESGSTHAFELEPRDDMKWPADLYLEGSDQHRGWFQSSLLIGAGTRGRAPYDAILTHGFTLDEKGYKMSKSQGNVVAPQKVIDQFGADVLRLWVMTADYTEDVRIGNEILKQTSDMYRRFRNTLRYLAGALEGFDPSQPIAREDMPELERWMLHRLAEVDVLMRNSVKDYAFSAGYTALHTFCANELSAFYLDIRKDSLYCDPLDGARRKAAQTVMYEIFKRLTAWLAPVLCFTAEEAWLFGPDGDESGSIHFQQFPETPEGWVDDALNARWTVIRDARRVVTQALEKARSEGVIRSSLQAAPTVYLADDALTQVISAEEFADVCITSDVTFVQGEAPADASTVDDVAGVAAVPTVASGEKCGRCWKVLPTVGTVDGHDDVCPRCAGTL